MLKRSAVLWLLMWTTGWAAIVQEIRVEQQGAALIDQEYVRAHISLAIGDEFTRSTVTRDVKTLQKTGRFTYVETKAENAPGGVLVTYVVEGKYKIGHLLIDGADYLGNKKIRELLELKTGDLADETTLAVKAQKVTDSYSKKYFPDAKLTWKIVPDPDQPGFAKVHITVKEGKRSIVRRILFTGNKDVRRKPLLKVMKQKQSNWLSWITNDGRYSPEDLEFDMESLRQVFLDKGYLDVKIGEPQITPIGRRKIDILIPIQEGPLYRLGTLQMEGIALFPTNQVAGNVTLKSNDVASWAQITAAAQSIRDFYGSRGYIRSIIDPVLDTDTNTLRANVDFKITEGTLAYINNILIRGNTRTKDKVIRRELSVYPGDIYNEVKVRTSEKRLKNLGYFDYVSSNPQSTMKLNQYDLIFDVNEQKTGQFMIGAGFSSIDEVLGFVELSQGNFDLFGWPYFTGGGQKLKLRAQFGTKRTDYEISFVEPWFLNRRLSLGVDLFSHDSRFLSDEYDQSNIGGNITLGKPLTSYDRINLIYGLEDIDVYNVSTNASDLIKEEEGRRTKSSMTLEVVHDSRDNVFIPTRGNRSTASATLAGGPFGGNTDLYQFQLRGSQYFPIWFDHVFNLRGWASIVEEYGDSDRVPIFDRLFLGGARTLRAFKYRDVGPKDENGEPIGGKSAIYGTAEYSIPVAEKLRLAVFYDTGMVWADAYEFNLGDLNSGVGTGVRLDFPGFPIQLDYSWPIEADEFNDRPSGRFSFWIGYTY
ncbi:MAG: outer membrane protein assembly factor BamA [Lentisphaerae bacterium GWF2_57_35]|nr:MAG: outer membrane protein assembly factor BamA [Lentisphaerae bacterium GWF2_57_35]